MKHNWLIVIFLLTGCATASKQLPTIETIQATPPSIEEAKTRKTHHKDHSLSRLPTYEKLTYKVKWTGLPVGTLTATIKGIEQLNGRDVYVFELWGKSNAFISSLYNMNSRVTSYMDVETLQTLRFEVDRSEGRYRKIARTDFDHENLVARFHNSVDDSRKEYALKPGTVDPLSSIYYFRLLPLEVGDEYTYPVTVSEQLYNFWGSVEKKKTFHLAGFGKVQAVYVIPDATIEGKPHKKGSLRGYFDVGPYKIPLTAVLKGPLFTQVTATLTDVEYQR